MPAYCEPVRAISGPERDGNFTSVFFDGYGATLLRTGLLGKGQTWLPIPSRRFCCSCSEDEASSDRRMDHFVGHFSPHEVVESLPCTMTWNQIIRIHVFEGRNDLPNVLVG